jgi:hypothetical protein
MNQGRKAFRAANLLLAVLFFVLFSSDFLSGSESLSQYRFNKEYFNRFGKDIGEVLTAPFRWQKKELLQFSTVLTAGALMLVFDDSIQDWVRENKTEDSTNAARTLTQLGDGSVIGALLFASYLSGEIFNKKRLRKAGLLGVESFVISSALVYVLKFTVGRARPYSGETTWSYHPFALSSRYYSFPSGHASAAFSVATVIADQAEEVWIDVLVYTLAGLVAVTRVHEDKHYLSDVFIGSAIGYFVGKKICDLHRNGRSKKLNVGFSLSSRCQALTLSYVF